MFRKATRSSEAHKLDLGTEVIDITVTFSRRKSTAIIVRPNRMVEIKAPLRASVPNILKFAAGKCGWVQKQREKFKGRAGSAKPREYAEGEVFFYLGQPYKLRLVTSKITRVEINTEFLEVHSRAKSPAAVKAILKFWYNEKARQIFAERMSICLQATEVLKLPKYKILNVKKMKSRWGSCSSARIITLNPELIAAPMECVDYVIIHELCHLREHNHSPRYYKLLSIAMPGWKHWREFLNRNVATNFI